MINSWLAQSFKKIFPIIMSQEGLPTPPKPTLKLTPKEGAPVKPGEGGPKFRVTRSPFAPKIKPGDGTPAPMPTPSGASPVPTPATPSPTPAPVALTCSCWCTTISNSCTLSPS